MYITHKDLKNVPVSALDEALWFVDHHPELFPKSFASRARDLQKERGPAIELNDICSIIRFFSLLYSGMSKEEGNQ